MTRLAVSVRGIVQGVGFRPFVHAAATRRGLSGWVQNRPDGVHLEVQGPEEAVRDFVETLRRAPPPPARVERVEVVELPPAAGEGFRILESAGGAAPRPTVPADLALCAECAAEVLSPVERRHRYPFTNCTRCGPRYSLIEALPYDRPRTTMKGFALCAACAAEYGDPSDRRFHAQPIACPACGPALRFLSPRGEEQGRGEAALQGAAAALRAGEVLALKGLGGFQLLVDATSPEAVALLRHRKGREEKPFAVMFLSLEAAGACCAVSPADAEALASPEAPIVLLRRWTHEGRSGLAEGVAPRNPWIGAMLPYTPLHLLLLQAVARPLVCTSGNLSEEPMCVDEAEARVRLGGVADGFLVHDRPIARPVDDSLVRVEADGPRVLRRARGFAPLPLAVPRLEGAPCVLALGGQLKSTVALAREGQVVVSQHLGDLFSPEGASLHERTAAELVRFLDARPAVVACDLHPDYASTRLAEQLASAGGLRLERVQHHHAHVAACMAEHGLDSPVLGLAWDGSGLGTDGTLWGGEALVVDGPGFWRVAHLRPFSLPGGERALREPRRAALGLLYALFGTGALEHAGALFPPGGGRLLLSALERGVNAPRTSSVGRLFDAVAALAGIRERAGFEGQAAMELEFAAAEAEEGGEAYPLPLGPGEPAVLDWEPLVREVLRDRARGVPPSVVASRFHEALAEAAEAIVSRVGLPRVVLSGGCFQNARLARRVRERLAARGLSVYLPRLYPPNDGGLSLGQAWVAALRGKERSDVPRDSR